MALRKIQEVKVVWARKYSGVGWVERNETIRINLSPRVSDLKAELAKYSVAVVESSVNIPCAWHLW
jgi:hypothetical protein